MSKITSAAAPKAARHSMTTRTLAGCALLAAMSVVLARFVIPMPAVDQRFSLEAVPIFIAGMLFGPISGALVGFSADLVGCLFSGYGYNPLFCVPPILYGLSAGLFRPSRSAPSCTRVQHSPMSTARALSCRTSS